MTLDGSGRLSYFVQLDIAQFMDDATGILAENIIEFYGFLRSSRMDFMSEPFLNCPPLLGFCPFALYLLHLLQFLQLRGRL